MMRKIWITALLLSATPVTAWAQQAQSVDDDHAPATDDALASAATDIVVTASGQRQRLIDVPASVSVITAEQLAVRPVRDLTDILDRSEGVTLNRAGNQRTIQIRGLPSNYTLFLIDGKRVNAGNAAFRGNNFDSNWVPVEAIARVEVVRGPLSSLYGTDAIGGVVNVITKPVGDAWHGTLAADSTVQQDHASGNYDKLGGYVSGPLLPGTLGIKLYGGHNVREADALTRNAAGATLAGFDRVEETFADGTLVWTPDRRNSVSLNYGYNRLLHGDTPLTRRSAALTYEGTFDWGHGQLRAYGNRIRNLAGNVSGRVQPNRASDGQVDGRLTVPVAALRQTFTAGGEYRDQSLYDPAHLTGMPGVPGGSMRPSTRSANGRCSARMKFGSSIVCG